MTTAADWCLEQLGYRFADETLLLQALTHSSANRSNNERLEFLGDAVLGFVVAQELYDLRPDADEGGLSRLRAELVRRDTLAELARNMDLGSQVIMASAEHRSGGHQRTKSAERRWFPVWQQAEAEEEPPPAEEEAGEGAEVDLLCFPPHRALCP